MQSSVIEHDQAEFMTSIHARYISILDDLCVDSSAYRVQPLTDKIINHFGKSVSITKSSNKQGNVLFNSKLYKERAIKSAEQCASSFECRATEVAVHIRAAKKNLWRASKTTHTRGLS